MINVELIANLMEFQFDINNGFNKSTQSLESLTQPNSQLFSKYATSFLEFVLFCLRDHNLYSYFLLIVIDELDLTT